MVGLNMATIGMMLRLNCSHEYEDELGLARLFLLRKGSTRFNGQAAPQRVSSSCFSIRRETGVSEPNEDILLVRIMYIMLNEVLCQICS